MSKLKPCPICHDPDRGAHHSNMNIDCEPCGLPYMPRSAWQALPRRTDAGAPGEVFAVLPRGTSVRLFYNPEAATIDKGEGERIDVVPVHGAPEPVECGECARHLANSVSMGKHRDGLAVELVHAHAELESRATLIEALRAELRAMTRSRDNTQIQRNHWEGRYAIQVDEADGAEAELIEMTAERDAANERAAKAEALKGEVIRHLGRTKAERNAATERAAEAEAEIVRIKSTTWCAYCDTEFPLDTVTAEQISHHVRACPKHPMREAETERNAATERAAEAETTVAKLRGYLDSVVYHLKGNGFQYRDVPALMRKMIRERDAALARVADAEGLLEEREVVYRETLKAGEWARGEATDAKGKLAVKSVRLNEAQAENKRLVGEVGKVAARLDCPGTADIAFDLLRILSPQQADKGESLPVRPKYKMSDWKRIWRCRDCGTETARIYSEQVPRECTCGGDLGFMAWDDKPAGSDALKSAPLQLALAKHTKGGNTHWIVGLILDHLEQKERGE